MSQCPVFCKRTEHVFTHFISKELMQHSIRLNYKLKVIRHLTLYFKASKIELTKKQFVNCILIISIVFQILDQYQKNMFTNLQRLKRIFPMFNTRQCINTLDRQQRKLHKENPMNRFGKLRNKIVARHKILIQLIYKLKLSNFQHLKRQPI